jgi:hypothetical protein
LAAPFQRPFHRYLHQIVGVSRIPRKHTRQTAKPGQQLDDLRLEAVQNAFAPPSMDETPDGPRFIPKALRKLSNATDDAPSAEGREAE